MPGDSLHRPMTVTWLSRFNVWKIFGENADAALAAIK
jgi:hypothetical protein